MNYDFFREQMSETLADLKAAKGRDHVLAVQLLLGFQHITSAKSRTQAIQISDDILSSVIRELGVNGEEVLSDSIKARKYLDELVNQAMRKG